MKLFLSDKLLRLGHLELVSNAHSARQTELLSSLRNEANGGVSSCYHGGVEIVCNMTKEHIIRLTKINTFFQDMVAKKYRAKFANPPGRQPVPVCLTR